MGRATEQHIEEKAGQQNVGYNANAETAFQDAQNSIDEQQHDIGDYSAQLSKFAGGNPYGNGGAYQTAVDQSTADTAAGAGQAATQAATSAAVRGGLNSSAGVAEGTKVGEQNTRDLMATQARANADRIAKGAQYSGDVLRATEVPATLQGAITGEQGRMAAEEGGLGNEALNVQQKAGEDPSFTDVLGENFAASLGKWAGGSRG